MLYKVPILFNFLFSRCKSRSQKDGGYRWVGFGCRGPDNGWLEDEPFGFLKVLFKGRAAVFHGSTAENQVVGTSHIRTFDSPENEPNWS